MSQRALIELLQGKGAHVSPIACMEDLSVELATRHLDGFPHSIADLVFHMNWWLDYELRRIRGERPKYPEHNAESFPSPGSSTSAADWERLRKHHRVLLEEFAILAKSSPQDLQREITHEANKNIAGSIESILWQMVAHNSYHVGQIALIRRELGAWPPKAGGDTW
ncbi:MAG TPA: DinB family protein [Candidatus Sulfotelmatobacter sp.]|nr:DinB family protein [Candidatus Sulfotelmatobacter sp.]